MKNILTTYKRIITGLVCISFLYSCNNKEWLSAKTKQDIAVPTTLKDFQALLDNPLSYFGAMNSYSPALGQLASTEFYITDASYTTRTDIEKNAYTWSKKLPYNLVYEWTNGYSRIVVCNIILEGLEKIEPSSEMEKQRYNDIKGQALFHRARTFYELAQIWAPVYNAATAKTDLSIPLRLESDINIPSVRSTVQETYDRVIGDLLLAKDLLPATAYKTRSSKIITDAMLARIYLSMEEYSKAFKHANNCLSSYKELIQYSDVNVTATAPFTGPELNKEIIFYSTMMNYGAVGSQVRIPQSIKDLYGANDLRGTAFFGTSGGLITFKGNYTGSASGRFIGLATDEIYLIRAECYARDNKTIEAMKDLNDLLRTRWSKVNGVTTYIDQVAANAEEALRTILLERKKELILRGLRWCDLRRLNRDERFKETLTRTVGGVTYTLEPNSYKYTFPLPDDVVQMTGMKQNEDWN